MQNGRMNKSTPIPYSTHSDPGTAGWYESHTYTLCTKAGKVFFTLQEFYYYLEKPYGNLSVCVSAHRCIYVHMYIRAYTCICFYQIDICLMELTPSKLTWKRTSQLIKVGSFTSKNDLQTIKRKCANDEGNKVAIYFLAIKNTHLLLS